MTVLPDHSSHAERGQSQFCLTTLLPGVERVSIKSLFFPFLIRLRNANLQIQEGVSNLGKGGDLKFRERRGSLI